MLNILFNININFMSLFILYCEMEKNLYRTIHINQLNVTDYIEHCNTKEIEL